jgi:hypothetical protein
MEYHDDYYNSEIQSISDELIIYELGTPDEIKLFEYLNTTLNFYIANDNIDDFIILNSILENGITYNIETDYPNTLPYEVAILFYSIDTKFNVSCEEKNVDNELFKRKYIIKINLF